MKFLMNLRFVPALVMFAAFIAVIASIVWGNGYENLVSLKESYQTQSVRNEELANKVGQLEKKVKGIQLDDRELEKAARNELGMASPKEMIFLFDEKGQEEKAKR